MDDSEVVKVLAEFMGRKIVPAANGSCWWFDDGDDGDDVDYYPVNYLTSYDTIAEVWNKLWRDNPYVADGALATLALAGEEYVLCFFPGRDPRDHAHALAIAISQSKGE